MTPSSKLASGAGGISLGFASLGKGLELKPKRLNSRYSSDYRKEDIE
jgi:hypothetical protein